MKHYILTIILLVAGASAYARPPNGFHKGPYFMLEGGVVNYSADDNARTGDKVGRDYEPTLGFLFGWNLEDYIAPELQVRYATNKNNDNREHIVKVNLNAVFSLITDQLTNFKTIRILPFLQCGPAFHFAAVPGDPLGGDRTIPLWGPGIGIGGGVRMLFMRYGYIGIAAQSDFILLPEKRQDINGTDTVIVKGGWDAMPSFLGMAGVHF